jgi:hypothetical protein
VNLSFTGGCVDKCVCVFITAIPITKLFAVGPVRNPVLQVRPGSSRLGVSFHVCVFITAGPVCVYYCSTYYKVSAVPGCVFITTGPSTKLFAWGGGDMGGHVLRETTSRGLCGLGCPSRTSERGGEGDCVKEGGGGEGKCERERALEQLRYYSPGH